MPIVNGRHIIVKKVAPINLQTCSDDNLKIFHNTLINAVGLKRNGDSRILMRSAKLRRKLLDVEIEIEKRNV